MTGKALIGILIVAVIIYLVKTIRDKNGNKKSSTGQAIKLHRTPGKAITHPDVKVTYPNAAPPSPFCDDPVYAHPTSDQREANHAFRMLRMEYDTIIKRHNRVSAKIRRVNAAAKEFDISGPEMQEVIDLCKKDIIDAPALIDYAKKYAAMREWEDYPRPPYESFKRLAVIYEKQGKYEEAIDICDQAIRLGLDNYDPKVSLSKKREKLIELADQKNKQTNPVQSIVEEPAKPTAPRVNTTREELQAYEIIRSMATELKLQDRITYKDTKSYFAILMDNNSRAWICRLKIESGPRWITFRPHNGNEEESYRINKIEEIYEYRNKIVSIIRELA